MPTLLRLHLPAHPAQIPQAQLYHCHGPTDTASTRQYPRGTFASSLPDPEALPTSSNQEQLPGDGGIRKSLISTSWRERRKNREDHLGKRQEDDREEHLERSDEPSKSRNQHSRLLAPQAAHNDGSVFPEPRTRGPGGGNTRNPATLWGERGLGRYGPAVDGSNL
ncbi:hypothetical protein NDU88_005630 [Pleurodeles waltl]|uniref:Uncharacterized protein n=1 Tax=Pleurodeles waltl TaxID=8319 RepID=A0AAV7TUJ1_PLEWA|nr:hypothetical protein NDU88_005630 [Pleurodeles waltl]